VTGLGELSPLGRFFFFGRAFLITEKAKNIGLLFSHGDKKYWFGNTYFSIYSSGHPVAVVVSDTIWNLDSLITLLWALRNSVEVKVAESQNVEKILKTRSDPS
jgi:hypothetical protein